MNKLPSKLIISVIAIVTLLSAALPFLNLFAFASYNKTSAKAYLLNHSNSPWATMGLAAIGETQIPSDHLKTVLSNTANDYAKTILAITALDKDPRTFTSEDYIAKLKTFHTQNQIGDSTTINDDIFAMLALVSSGEPLTDPAISDAKKIILQNQNS